MTHIITTLPIRDRVIESLQMIYCLIHARAIDTIEAENRLRGIAIGLNLAATRESILASSMVYWLVDHVRQLNDLPQ